MIEAWKQRLGGKTSNCQSQEVKGKAQDGPNRIAAQFMNQEQRQPSGNRPFTSKLKKEKQAQQQRRNATKIPQGLARYSRFPAIPDDSKRRIFVHCIKHEKDQRNDGQ